MKVLVLTHNLPRFPGDFSGTFIDALCTAMAGEGASVEVVAPHDRAYSNSLKQRPYGLRLYRYAWPASLETVGYMRSLIGDLKVRKASLAVTPLMLLAGTVATIKRVRAFPPDVIHAHWLLPNGLIGALASTLTGIPLAVSIPGSDLLVARLNPVARALTRFVLHRASLVTSNSEELKSVALSLGADSSRFDLIIYGVDPHAMQPDPVAGSRLREKLGIDPEEFLILAVGRMVPKKGFRYLAEAMGTLLSSAPRSRLLFIGDGVERPLIEQVISAVGASDKTDFVGVVRREQIPDFYNAADVLVMPSVTEPEDGLNVCVLDAMSCGKPIVATMVAGNSLVVRDGINGYLVPERQPEALAARLSLLAGNRDLAQSLGAESRLMVEQEFSWQSIAAQYLDHFRAFTAGVA